jgi:hypothetical protein
MAYERNPNDPYRSNPADDPYRTSRTADEFRRATRFDNELPMDPELAEGPAGGARVALFAIAIAVVLGVMFYGLNNSSVNHSGPSTAQNTSQSSPPAAPPGMRDVTPRANIGSGVTTGVAPARPAPPPAANNAPASNAPSK